MEFATYSRHMALIIGLCAASMATAQSGRFTVNGRLKVDGGALDGARMVVYKNGVKERTVTTNLNRFSLGLDLHASYVLSFEKDGFVAKKLLFDTRLPSSSVAREYAAFEFAVSLFKQYDDVNIVVFDQPVGKIRYEPSMDDFDYDTDYTKSIQSQLQAALDAVEQKQKEEAREAAAEAKREAAEAKAREKADAQARKAEEAEQRAQQERAEQQRREEEQRKAEEAARVAAAAKEKEEAQRREAERSMEEPVKEVAATSPVRPAPAPVRGKTVTAISRSGMDVRRSTIPVMGEDQRPLATPGRMGSDEAKYPEHAAVQVERQEELVVEPTKVMTIIRLAQGEVTHEYRRVVHKWGGTFYFKNGESCSQQTYEHEALSGREQPDERLVDMPGR